MVKKAEMSVGMIIGIVIVILTFGIIAIVYSQLFNPVDIDREVCKQSAIFRGTLPGGTTASQTKDLISLKCKTKRICVTTKNLGKGECENDLGEGFSTYRISSDKRDTTKAEQQIKTILAREMADCWDMLGRGNLQIFSKAITTEKNINSVGVICSRVVFDKTVVGLEGLNLQEIKGMNYYLLNNKVPNKELSYWDFLRNAYDGETMQLLYGQSVKDEENKINTNNFLNAPTDITKTKAIIYIESSPTVAGQIFGGIAGGTAGAIGSIFMPKATGYLIGGGIFVGQRIGNWIQVTLLRRKGYFQGKAGDPSASAIFLIDYTNEGFKDFRDSQAGFEIASYA